MASSTGIFSATKMTIEQQPILGTCGYDIHFAFVDEDAAAATTLRENLIHFIEEFKTMHPEVDLFVTENQQFNRTVGPWKQWMWEVQISAVPKDQLAHDLSAISVSRMMALHRAMKTMAAFTENRMAELGLQGSLLIHANSWPECADMDFERRLHEEQSWVVCGKRDFKPIWTKALIPMQQFVNEKLEAGVAHADIKAQFKAEFAGNAFYGTEPALERAANFLIQGYLNQKIVDQSYALVKRF